MKAFARVPIFVALVVTALPGWAQTDRVYKLHIPREPLTAALKEFARQTGLQIAGVADTMNGSVLVGPVDGNLSAGEALRKLLEPAGLSYKMANDHTVAVVNAERTRAATGGALRSPGSGSEESTTTQKGTGADSQPQLGPADTSGEGTPEGSQPSSQSSIPVLEHITITGSRLHTVTPTAEVTIIDAETIAKRGFSTVEDIVRSLPQNMSTSNTVRSLLQPTAGDKQPVGPAAQGESEANLRGLGQGATLVLVDGRRTSGSPAFSGDSVNLASIPVAAIERVEILSDSAAAVYGSDAIGGVINIVLKKNYEGANTAVRYEYGANGGDKLQADQLLGLKWGTGNVTTTFSFAHTLPIDSARVGYVTNNMAPQGGVDARSSIIGQPGSIMDLMTGASGSLPRTFSGTEPWTAANLSPKNFVPGDLVPPEMSSDIRSEQFYLNFNQRITDRIDSFGDLRFSDEHDSALTGPPTFITNIAPSNPYNRLGDPLFAFYAPVYEIQHGLIPTPVAQNVLKALTVDLGLRTKLPFRDWTAEVTGTYSTSQSRSASFTYEQYDSTSADGLTPMGRLFPTELNPFGNGTAQNLTLLENGYGASNNITDRKTRLKGLTLSAEGGVLTLPAGSVRVAAGGEFRREELLYGADDYLANAFISDHHPSQNIAAVFGETAIPLLESLTASLQGRWERYVVSSSDTVIDGKTFSKLTPRLGLVWKGPDRLLLRASWSRSFKAPGLNDLAALAIPGQYPLQQYDPIKNETVAVFSDYRANPNLRPQQGETTTAGFEWMPPEADGLRIAGSFNRTRFSDQVRNSLFGSLGTLTIADLLARPDLFPGIAVRGPDGTLERLENSPYNLASLTVRSVDFDIGYFRSTSWGDFSAGVQGMVTLSYDQQLVPLLSAQELAGTTAIDKRRATLSLGWSRGHYGLNVYGNYTGPYLDTDMINLGLIYTGHAIPALQVPSRTTWDFSGYYEAPWGVKISGGLRDAFNAKFPFAQTYVGPFDTTRVDLRGRVIHAELQKEFNF